MNFAVAIRTGTVRRVWFAIRTAMGIFLAIVGGIFVFFDFYNLTLVKQQQASSVASIWYVEV